MAKNPVDKVNLTMAQLKKIAQGGTISAGTDQYTGDLSAIYLVKDAEVVLTQKEFDALPFIDKKVTYYIIEG